MAHPGDFVLTFYPSKMWKLMIVETFLCKLQIKGWMFMYKVLYDWDAADPRWAKIRRYASLDKRNRSWAGLTCADKPIDKWAPVGNSWMRHVFLRAIYPASLFTVVVFHKALNKITRAAFSRKHINILRLVVETLRSFLKPDWSV